MSNQKQCPFCKEYYDKNLKICPHCSYKEPLSLDKTLWIFIILLLAFTIYKFAQEHFTEINFNLSTLTKLKEPKEIKEIELRPMSELSSLSREEIFSSRKDFVRKSIIFKEPNYSPSEDVYKIEDNLPWIGADEIIKNGAKGNENIGTGLSRHSIMINNPDLLFGFIIPELKIKAHSKTANGEIVYENPFCFEQYTSQGNLELKCIEGNALLEFAENNAVKSAYFEPKQLLWNEKEQTIEAYFNISSFKKHFPSFSDIYFYLDETNARDLGYNWVWSSENSNISFEDYKNNISTNIYKMKGFYHKGYACGLEEGCNNYSPYQKEMVFKILDTGHIKMKLWKNKPMTVLQKPDITYIMYFE